MRIVVAQPEGVDHELARPVSVGVVRWTGPRAPGAGIRAYGPKITILLKAAYTFGETPGDAPLEPLPDAPAFSLEQPSALPGAGPEELAYPTDFAPFKEALDVILVGHAHAPRPTSGIFARLRAGGVAREFTLISAAPALRIPMTLAHVRGPDGVSAADPVGPVRPSGAPHERPGAFDPAAHQAASPAQRGPYLEPGDAIEIGGLASTGDRTLRLPAVSPRVYVDIGGEDFYPVDVVCDTLLIDTDEARVVVVWRGSADADAFGRRIHRILASLEDAASPRGLRDLCRGLHRGAFSYAIEPNDVTAPMLLDPAEIEELRAARFEAWAEDAPEPMISLEQYAELSAELSEWPDQRADTLRRHDLDEDGWVVEERAWLEKMADGATEGDGTLAADYGERFMKAQDGLARPEELDRGIDEYAAIFVAMEVARDPMKALSARGITLPVWLRLDRRMQRDAAESRDVADAIARALDEARAAAPAADDSEEA